MPGFRNGDWYKLAPENYFQATSRKPDMSIFLLMAVLNVWLVSVVILLSAPLHSAQECLLRMQSVVLPLLLR